jgi:hypothetical protein
MFGYNITYFIPLIYETIENDYDLNSYKSINATMIFYISGFTVFDKACCLPRSEDGMCVPNSNPCLDRNKHVFYDAIHPTSALNYLTALTSYDSTAAPQTTTPMDIKRLAQYSIN